MSKLTTVADACAWARKEASRAPRFTRNWSLVCDHALAVAWGSDHSDKNDHTGFIDARHHWLGVPATRKHHEDRNPPAGALLFWGSESTGQGHAALSLGNHIISSTDILGSGGYYVVPFGEIEYRWSMPYLGWTDPVFNNGWTAGIRLSSIAIPPPKAHNYLKIPGLLILAEKHGFQGERLIWAVAVAMAESSGGWWEVNVNNDTHLYPNGKRRSSRDRGLWQINDFWHSEVTDVEAFDPDLSAIAAYKISNGGKDWSPWSSYHNGQAASYVSQVRKALALLSIKPVPPVIPKPVPPVIPKPVPPVIPTPVQIVHTPPVTTPKPTPASVNINVNWLLRFIYTLLHLFHLR